MSDNHDETQNQHERLCAFLFGEFDEAERTALEAELAASPELRAERERIEATIALVRDAVPAGDALSESARMALTSAAAGKPANVFPNAFMGPGWRSSRPPLAAAAAVVIALGALAFQGYRSASGPASLMERRVDTIARAPAAEREVRDAAKPADTLASNIRSRVMEDAREMPPLTAGHLGTRGQVLHDADRERVKTRAFGRDEIAFDEAVVAEFGANANQPVPPERDEVAESLEQPRALGYVLTEEGELEALRSKRRSGAEGAVAKVDALSVSLLDKGGVPFDGVQAINELAQQRGLERKKTMPAEAAREAEFRVSLARITGGRGGKPAVPSSGPSSPGPSGVSSTTTLGIPVTHAKDVKLEELYRLGRADLRRAETGARGRGAWSLSELLAPVNDPEVALKLMELNGFGADVGEPAPPADDGRTLYFETGIDLDDESGVDGFLLGKDVQRQFGGGYRLNTAADLEAYCDQIVRFCRIRPQETPSMMFFRCWGDNPFELTQLDALSTFAADVDTASYTLARSYLDRGHMPTKEQIRTEEFVNYFDSGVPAPAQGVFDVELELAPSCFGTNGEWMLRVVLAGKQVDKAERDNLALTFVVDTSGSMKQGNRIELVKHALRLLLGELYPNDALAIVAFSTEARLVLPMTSAASKGVIESAIFGLTAEGSTNAEAGLLMGYEIAGAALTANAQNRVVLLSDGVANVGNTDEGSILDRVAHQRQKGIYLNTVGVGMGNHNDALLEQLADKGDGLCNYIDTPAEAYKVLVENFTSAFQSIARDVKIQVEFDAAQVQSYRLLGYENRTVADVDFRNDAVDAGEVGAGHQVTALYELVRQPGSTPDGPLATARVRYKAPFAVDGGELDAAARAKAEEATEISASIGFEQVATGFSGTTPGYQRAVLVAQLAEILRRSVHARGDSYDLLINEVTRLERETKDADFTEFCKLVVQHRALILAHLPSNDDIAKAIEELTRHQYLKGQLEQLHEEAGGMSAEEIERLQRGNDELEARIYELIKKQLETQGR